MGDSNVLLAPFTRGRCLGLRDQIPVCHSRLLFMAMFQVHIFVNRRYS